MRIPVNVRRGLLPLAVMVGVTLAGCSGDDNATVVDDQVVEGQVDDVEDGAAPDADLAGPDAVDEDLEAAGEAGAPAQEGVEGEALPEAAVGRDLVFRASITLASDDPDATAAAVRTLATEAGGFVSDAQLQRNDLGLLAGSITIRVPSDNLEDLLTRVSDTGADVVAEQRSTEDVTGQLTDIDSQLRNLEALEEELLVVLTEARDQGDVDDIVTVFDRITGVRGQIEVLEGRRAGLADLVALSTLTVVVEPSRTAVAEATQVPEADRPLPWSPGSQATSAWDQTVAAARDFVDGAIWVAVYFVPVAVLWLLPLVLVLLLARRWWRRRAVAPGSGGGAVPPPVPASPVSPAPRGPSTDPGDAGPSEVSTTANDGPATAGPATAGPATDEPGPDGPGSDEPGTDHGDESADMPAEREPAGV